MYLNSGPPQQCVEAGRSDPFILPYRGAFYVADGLVDRMSEFSDIQYRRDATINRREHTASSGVSRPGRRATPSENQIKKNPVSQ